MHSNDFLAERTHTILVRIYEPENYVSIVPGRIQEVGPIVPMWLIWLSLEQQLVTPIDESAIVLGRIKIGSPRWIGHDGILRGNSLYEFTGKEESKSCVGGIYLAAIGKETLGFSILSAIVTALFGYIGGLGTPRFWRKTNLASFRLSSNPKLRHYRKPRVLPRSIQRNNGEEHTATLSELNKPASSRPNES